MALLDAEMSDASESVIVIPEDEFPIVREEWDGYMLDPVRRTLTKIENMDYNVFYGPGHISTKFAHLVRRIFMSMLLCVDGEFEV